MTSFTIYQSENRTLRIQERVLIAPGTGFFTIPVPRITGFVPFFLKGDKE
ncbi:MAG: hypothetical protein GXY48_08155 [Methanomicrobiales archaeon]|nr:hypothetical protein [Methanomicrobiales archaeon]